MIKIMDVLGKRQKISLVLLLFFGTLIQSFTMLRSGLPYSFGLGFWGPNGHDGIWHLALINQVLKSFPPPHSTFAGELLTNYHYFYDLLVALISKITFIPVINLYFQILPLLMAFLLGLLSFLIGWKLGKNFRVGFWFAFLNYFAGSFGYVVTFLKDRTIGGESLFWSMQSVSAQINPPFAFSLVVILFGIWLLISVKELTRNHILLLCFTFGILINIKVYAGIIILPALFIYSLVKFRKGQVAYLKIFLLSLIISATLFFAINRNSAQLIVFQPFWFIHSMIESPDRLYIPKLALARYRFLAEGDYFQLFLIEGIGLFLFLAGNLGTRIFGLIPIIQKIKNRRFEEIEIFFLVGGLVALIIPLFFIQKGSSWNTIQFFYYFLFFANYFTALFLSTISFKRPGLSRLKYIAFVLFILFTIPTTYSTLKNYTGMIPPAALPKTEMKALDFLKNQPDGFVLTYPYSPYVKRDLGLLAPIPLYAYETSAYVSAFSQKQTYLEDEMNLDISNYNWQARRLEIEKYLIRDEDEFKARGLLVNNQIKYLYLVGGQSFKYQGKSWERELIYDKENVRIYKVIW